MAYVIEDDSDGSFYTIVLAEVYKTRLKELGGVVPDRIRYTHIVPRNAFYHN